MGLPKVTIGLGNGGLKQTVQTDDGVIGLVITGATITGANNVTANKVYQIFSLIEAENLGITESNTNSFAWQQIKDFYSIAKTGAELWFMIVVQATTMEDMADETKDFGSKVIATSKGRVRTLALSRKSTGTIVTVDGLDTDVHKAVVKAQTMAESFALRNRPFRVIIDGKDYSGTIVDLKDYSINNKNRVGILIGNDNGSKNASIGLFIGRKASVSIQRNLGVVRDGAIIDLNAYLTNGADVELSEAGWDAIHDKGYMFYKSFTGKAGYFVSHTLSLTAPTDDYKKMNNGWVIDKAQILAYLTFLDEVLEEIPINTNGQIHPALIKAWEGKIENTINQQMTAKGQISGVKSYIDANQQVLSTGELKVDLQILPVAYSEYIKINLQFTTDLNQ